MPATPPAADRIQQPVRLTLTRIPVLPCLRTGAVAGVLVGLLAALAVFLLWALAATSGTFAQLAALTGASSSSQATVTAAFGLPAGLAAAAIVGSVSALDITALATIAPLLYNAAARLAGGLRVTFAPSEASASQATR